MGDGIPLLGLLLILITIINYFLNMSKVSFDNVNASNIKKNSEKDKTSNDRIIRMLESNNRLLYTFDIMLFIIYLVSGIFIYLFIKSLSELIYKDINNIILSIVAHIITSIVVVVFMGIFGVILPQKRSIKKADKNIYKVNNIIYFIFILFKPTSYFIDKTMKLLFRIIGIDKSELEDNVTEEEIISMVHEGKEQGVFEESEVEMISNIIDLNDKEAQDIMTHKKKTLMINVEENINDALKFMLAEGFSRYPLYEETKDNILGVLHLKDVINYHLSGESDNVNLKDIAREALFVPDTQNISVLFHEMQSRNIHMAIAIDEYGQTAGIVAMEDILEEIVGNIWDEYDTKEKMIINKGDNVFIVLGAISLEELEEELNIDLVNEDYDTLNGLLISLLDRIPQDGEKAIVDYKGYRFHVLSTGNRMIEKVKISKLEEM